MDGDHGQRGVAEGGFGDGDFEGALRVVRAV
jgi:hypothetical protein